MRFKVFKLTLLLITVLYLLDAGTEASKNRKKHRHRSKRTHGKKPRQITDTKTVTDKITGDLLPKLIEKQKRFKPHKSKRRGKFKKETEEYKLPDNVMAHVIKEQMERKRQKLANAAEFSSTMLPSVTAKLDFFIKRKATEVFYESPSTPVTTFNGFSASELGLRPFQSCKGNYGLHSTAGRAFGKIIHITDPGRTNSHFGCGNAIGNLHKIPQNDPWIALIERGHCSFLVKIKLAERNNASAVIFYDNKVAEVPRINTIGNRIISVIMTKKDGHSLRRIADSDVIVMASIAADTEPLAPTTITKAIDIEALFDTFSLSLPTTSKVPTTSRTSLSARNARREISTTTHGGAIAHNKASFIMTLFTAIIAIFYHRAVTS